MQSVEQSVPGIKQKKVPPKFQESKFKNNQSLFIVKSGNDWIKQAMSEPPPKPLYHCFWNENELCILFAEANAGKSILAVQIANEIAAEQPVIYFDFELTAKQFEKRYSIEYENHYKFPENFLRAEMNPEEADYEAYGYKSLEEFINSSIENEVVCNNAKVIIIDNITYLKNETEKSKEALPLMKHLNAIKKRYGLSILALAHTPKRNLSAPVTRNDLSGSKMLMNFCDSSFAIGESTKDPAFRYLKQIKVRASEFTYHTENVLIRQISKESNFLSFTTVPGVHTSDEREHLKVYSNEDKQGLKELAKSLHIKHISYNDIAKQLGIGKSTAFKYVNEP